LQFQDSLFFHFKDTDTAYKQQLLTIKRGLSCDAKDPDARDWVESVLCSGGVAFDDSTCATLTPEAMMNRCGLRAAQKRNPVWIHAVGRASRNKRDKDREKELFDVSFGEVQASTDMFPCPRCGKRDCR
jgi:hypothetical protein